MAARKASGRHSASKAPTERPRPRADKVEVGSVTKPTDLAALARSYATLKQRLADTEVVLAREKQERSADADTIAEMLLRIVGLEKSLKTAASSDVRSRSLGPPAAHTGAMQRVASLESRVDDAVMRARAAETRAAEAESRARTANERVAEVTRDQESLRASLADADARARTAEDRVAHAEQLAKSAKLRAIELNERFESMQTELVSLEVRARAAESRARDRKHEEPLAEGRERELELVRIQLEAAHGARDDARIAIATEKDSHQRELEQQRDRHAMALRAAHDAYAEAFNETLEDERQRTRDELEEERARTRQALGRVAELEDLLKCADDRTAAAVTKVRSELEAVEFDRDAADRQSELTMMQLQAAEAKLQLVGKQLARAEESIGGLAGADRSVVDDLLERIRSARGALAVSGT